MRIGIITFYHNNLNYGGNLQAYALYHICSAFGNDVKLISYENEDAVLYYLKRIKQKLVFLKAKRIVRVSYLNRKRVVLAYKSNIPHTKLFFKNNIFNINNLFDCFICGSDQIWNPSWLNSLFDLSFKDNGKRCIAYAPSLGTTDLSLQQRETYKRILRRCDAISVRESETIPLLQPLTEKKIRLVLDPTLLLDSSDWEALCSPPIIQQRYLFCFLFGKHTRVYQLARKVATKKDLRIVIIPFLNNQFSQVELTNSDIQLSNVSPIDFLSLIKYSDFVITDSFHATVFSYIFKKQFVSYADNSNKTRVRIQSLTDLLGLNNHFLGDSDIDFESVEKIPEIDYDNLNTQLFESMKEQSITFLKDKLREQI